MSPSLYHRATLTMEPHRPLQLEIKNSLEQRLAPNALPIKVLKKRKPRRSTRSFLWRTTRSTSWWRNPWWSSWGTPSTWCQTERKLCELSNATLTTSSSWYEWEYNVMFLTQNNRLTIELQDVCMPVMDGLQATRLIRSFEETGSWEDAVKAGVEPPHQPQTEETRRRVPIVAVRLMVILFMRRVFEYNIVLCDCRWQRMHCRKVQMNVMQMGWTRLCRSR